MINEVIRKTIISMVEGLIPIVSTWVKVKSVTDQTCTIILNDLEIEGILLGFDKSDVVVYPKINTQVLVMFTDNSKTNGAVVLVKETDKIEMMGNEFGGLGLTEKIAERIKRLEDSVKSIETKFNQHLTLYGSHVHSGGTISGSTGITVPDTTNISNENLTPRTTQNYISNDKVTHGHG
jgi:hypothetical protein